MYRDLPKPPKYIERLATGAMASMWFWLMWRFYHEPEDVTVSEQGFLQIFFLFPTYYSRFSMVSFNLNLLIEVVGKVQSKPSPQG